MMNLQAIKEHCENWTHTNIEFSAIVSSIIHWGTYPRELATEFEVAESTVRRWASGVAVPLPGLQVLIVNSIYEKVKDSLDENPRKLVGRRYSTRAELLFCPLALYKIYWKSGGASLASVGFYHDGARWVAPTNWTAEGRQNPCGDMGKIYTQIESMVLVACSPEDVN